MDHSPPHRPVLRRIGYVLVVAGTVGYLAVLTVDLLMPKHIPGTLVEDRIRLSQAPQIYSAPKSSSYLELTDGTMPARVSNFDYIEPASTRERLLALRTGEVIVVLRPRQATDWLTLFDIVAVRSGDERILPQQATVAAHKARLSGSRGVLLYLSLVGVIALVLRRLLSSAAHAA